MNNFQSKLFANPSSVQRVWMCAFVCGFTLGFFFQHILDTMAASVKVNRKYWQMPTRTIDIRDDLFQLAQNENCDSTARRSPTNAQTSRNPICYCR